MKVLEKTRELAKAMLKRLWIGGDLSGLALFLCGESVVAVALLAIGWGA